MVGVVVIALIYKGDAGLISTAAATLKEATNTKVKCWY
jgi:hypothetical protein